MAAIAGNVNVHPFSINEIVYLIISLFLLFCSACVSASEVAYFSLTPKQLTEIKKSGSKASRLVLAHHEHPRRLLATILIANNFVNIAIVILTTFVITSTVNFSGNFVLAFVVQVVAVTFLLLMFGEILPKVFAAQHPIWTSRNMALPLSFLDKLFSPISFLLLRSTYFLDRRVQKKGLDITMDDLSNAIDITGNDKSIEEEEQKMLKGIVNFGNIDAIEIMTARVDVAAIDINTPYPKVLQTIVESGYSRIPAFRDSFDNIEGILYIKDLLKHLEKGPGFQWNKILRPAFFVPENIKLNALLQDFREKKNHMAIVVDEYGGTQGIITLEDIIEEITGEINDEFDTEEIIFSQIDERNYIFEAKTQLHDFCKIIGIDDSLFDDVKGESETLAGLLLELKGEIPPRNVEIKCKNFLFKVESVDKRRIKRIRVTLPKENPKIEE
ncbi:MAG: gliding motility-associated protein GldE [Bacteroidetes bacterium]|nr:gliding motility-associated protein GldE [Bacteroidota bacterium]MBU1719852.1 gliding motility-associated protein GldE [Bacteroidota bacterium]